MRNNFLVFGLVLIAYPFFLLLQKLYVETRYDLHQLDKNQFSFAGKGIEIIDDFQIMPNSTDMRNDQRGRVRIKIDGADHSSHTEVLICTDLQGKDRYQGWLAVLELVDNFARNKSIVIVQRLDEMNEDASNLLKIRFRFIYIPLKGKTWTEILSTPDLNSIAASKSPMTPYYKLWIARSVRPEQMYDFPADPSAKTSLRRWRHIEPLVIFFAGIVGLIFALIGFWRLVGSKNQRYNFYQRL